VRVEGGRTSAVGGRAAAAFERAVAAISRVTGPAAGRAGPRAAEPGEAVLATWHWLLDDGRLQDDEPHLAGTRKKPRLHLSETTAKEIGAAPGELVSVRTERGVVSLPLVLADLPDRVVWLPTYSPGSHVRRQLAAGNGSLVRLSVDGPR
jgi:NADH-quinone oxidoreductase subunit G